MNSTFKPAWWLPGSHLQTLWPALMRWKESLSLQYERLELSDGDFVDLAWVGRGSSPIVCILHGLCGGMDSPYINGILGAIKRQGWRAVLMHFRGCSGEPNRLAKSYHSGETGDLKFLLAELKKREPNTPLFGIGYSLGGNVLLKCLGETGNTNPLKAAAAVSVPFELAKTAEHLKKGFSQVYQKRLLSELKIAHRAKFETMPAPIEFGDIDQLNNFFEFDNAITAPLHGFKDAMDYYQQCSSRQYLKNIETPTLILHARNDPFTTTCSIPEQQDVSDKVNLEISEGGGHVGFVAGRYPWKPIYWLEKRITQYFAQFLS